MKICVKVRVEDNDMVVDVTSDDEYGHLVGVVTFVWKDIYAKFPWDDNGVKHPKFREFIDDVVVANKDYALCIRPCPRLDGMTNIYAVRFDKSSMSLETVERCNIKVDIKNHSVTINIISDENEASISISTAVQELWYRMRRSR